MFLDQCSGQAGPSVCVLTCRDDEVLTGSQSHWACEGPASGPGPRVNLISIAAVGDGGGGSVGIHIV